MAFIVDLFFWVSVYVAFHLLIRLYQFTYLELVPNILSEKNFFEKYMKNLSAKLGERRTRATLIAFFVIAILPFTVLSILVGYQIGLIIWAGTVLFLNFSITILELVTSYKLSKHNKENLLQLNSLAKENPSIPITRKMLDLLIIGFNSKEKEINQLTIETIKLLNNNEKVVKALWQDNIPKTSIYERITRRRTPSPDSVWHYLKKIDHMPVKRRGENVQRLSDEI
ncbi:MAG: hypothetical protein ACTSYA_01620 [Candidatus Kariarchaeaceae archaeon]